MRTITCTLALTLAASLSSAAQQPAQAPSPAVKTAEQQYKNIKALTGTPANQLNLSMHMIAADLGVECVHCHIWEHWNLDVKPTKKIARRMIVMVREMNKNFFGNAQIVTCYTCHRGSPTPVSIATLPDTVGLRGPSVPGAPLPVIEHAKQSPSFPPVAAILQKYVSALGGE